MPALAFLETAAFVGLLAPGETAVLVGGVVAERGEVSLPVMVLLVWAAAVAGDVASFLLGRHVGSAFLRDHASRFGVTRGSSTESKGSSHDMAAGPSSPDGSSASCVRSYPSSPAPPAFRCRILPYSVSGALIWSAAYTLAE